jgi:hypothetical protein
MGGLAWIDGDAVERRTGRMYCYLLPGSYLVFCGCAHDV